MIADLSRIFGDLRRWLLAVVLASVAYAAHGTMQGEQALSPLIAWASIKQAVGLVAVVMVFFAIQRRYSGHYQVVDAPQAPDKT